VNACPAPKPEPPRQFLETRTSGRIEGRRAGQGQNKQVELLDHESEGNDGDAGAKPGKKHRSLAAWSA
jgi:hypothetical protein